MWDLHPPLCPAGQCPSGGLGMEAGSEGWALVGLGALPKNHNCPWRAPGLGDAAENSPREQGWMELGYPMLIPWVHVPVCGWKCHLSGDR